MLRAIIHNKYFDLFIARGFLRIRIIKRVFHIDFETYRVSDTSYEACKGILRDEK